MNRKDSPSGHRAPGGLQEGSTEGQAVQLPTAALVLLGPTSVAITQPVLDIHRQGRARQARAPSGRGGCVRVQCYPITE